MKYTRNAGMLKNVQYNDAFLSLRSSWSKYELQKFTSLCLRRVR